MKTPKTNRRERQIARAGIESLATQCLGGAMLALINEHRSDPEFDVRSLGQDAGRLAVEIASAIRFHSIRVTGDMTDREIEEIASSVSEMEHAN